MNKIFLLSLILLLGCNNSNKLLIKEKSYSKVHTKINNLPNVIEFFSFLCPYCYNLEKNFRIDSKIKTQISKNITIAKYHIDFIGGKLGKLLTKIWIISKILKLENKVLIPIFEGIQIQHNITNVSNLTDNFLKLAKLNKLDFMFLKNSFVTKSILYKQKILEHSIHLDYVPAFLIQGKYLINNKLLNNLSNQNFIKNYINIIKFLLKKNNLNTFHIK